MPKIIINDIDRNHDTSSINNLNELYKNLLGEYKSTESFVNKIRLNGKDLTENELENNGNLPIKEIDSLELIILTVPEMALNNINNAMEYLNKLIPGIEKASELFRTKSEEEANKYYLQCVEGLAWFREVIDNVKLTLKEELDKLDFGSKSIEIHDEKMLSLTKELADSQSKKDWVMLADLLEYELLPYLEEWKSIMPLFVKAVQNKINSSG